MDSLNYPLLIIAILPAFLFCYLAVNSVFRENVVKIPMLFVIPLAIMVVFFFNFPLLFILARLFTNYCYRISQLPDIALEFLLTEGVVNILIALIIYVAFCATPATFLFFLCKWLKNEWFSYRKTKRRFEAINKKPMQVTNNFLAAKFVERFILHHFAILTSYDPHKEELMVDIRTNDGFLYSGKYGQYYLNGKSLSGISMYNVLKFDLRDSKQRSPPFLIPNNGELHILNKNITDIHFWKLKVNSTVSISLQTTSAATRLAWSCALQYALPDLNLKIVAYLKDQVDSRILKKLYNELARCGLSPADVKINFKKTK